MLRQRPSLTSKLFSVTTDVQKNLEKVMVAKNRLDSRKSSFLRMFPFLIQPQSRYSAESVLRSNVARWSDLSVHRGQGRRPLLTFYSDCFLRLPERLP